MKKRTRYVRIVGLGSAFTMDLVHPCQGEVISYLPVSGVSVECEVMELSLIYDLQNKYSDVVSLGSDSFDQAINKIDAAQELADEDLESNSCNSLPPNLSQIKLVSSNLIDCNLETTSETIMPASTSFKSPARPMSFSIAGYTERSTKETSYTEKLKVGRSDSSGSSSDSSIR